MQSKRFHHAVATAIALSTVACLAKTTKIAAPVTVPVEASLVNALEARLLQPGSPVFGEVQSDWQDKSCRLRAGAILKGHVVDVKAHSKTTKNSEIDISFDEAECDGSKLRPFPLLLVAVLAPPPDEVAGQRKYAGLNTMPVAVGDSFRSIAAASFDAEVSPFPADPVTTVGLGGIVGIHGLKLGVGTGPENSSALFARGRNVALRNRTRFLLVPDVFNTPPAPSTSATSNTAPSSAVNPAPGASAPPSPPPETEVADCIPPSCSEAPPFDDTVSAKQAGTEFSLRDLGYAPRYTVEMQQLDNEAAIAYLGRNELLVAFNPHTLVPRNGDDSPEAPVRVIKAVLLALPSMKIERTIEWRVPDLNPFLWSAGEGRVLVHTDNELRLYGPHLKLVRRFQLDGPLAYVRFSPSRKILAVGTIQERHPRQLHALLVRASGKEPEEDVEIRLLDSGFNPIATAIKPSTYPPLVLTDEGEIAISSQSSQLWHLVEYTWGNQKRSLARLHSTCVPLISSFPPDMLFVTTCNGSPQRQYRVLRANGKSLLKGYFDSAKMLQPIQSSDGSALFALGVTEALNSLGPEAIFRLSDLKNGVVSVYRARDGRRLSTTRVDDPASSNDVYALSPDGLQLAVLSAERISLYSLPANP